ncbi:glycosyltransferase [Phascolarctobacterium sp.]|uniref:glycosyltransferase n=1 Tax=Phascolarctobacterium sp. TaxID=2049039 RepID=UPI00386A4529
MKIMLACVSKMVGDTGGLAKVTCAMANEFINRGHEVSLVYDDEHVGEFFYYVCDEVRRYNLRECADGSIIKYPWYLKILREILRSGSKIKARTVNNAFNEKFLVENMRRYLQKENPDIVITSQPAASKLILCDIKAGVPVITMSHCDPEDYFHTYPKAELPSLTKSAVCQVLLPPFEQHIKNHDPEAKTITIGNAIPQYDFQAELDKDKPVHKIIFVGRLTKNHKRPHLLISAFAKLAAKYPNWQVELWGAKDRPAYYKELEHIVSSNHLEKQVFLKGTTDKVGEKLKEADIYAFPSAYEGFPLALGEAMSAGLPSIGYKNCPAVNEMIIDGKTGILCDEGVDAFAVGLDKLMSDQEMRVRMGKAAKEAMLEYAPKRVWDKWEELVEKVVKGNGR